MIGGQLDTLPHRSPQHLTGPCSRRSHLSTYVAPRSHPLRPDSTPPPWPPRSRTSTIFNLRRSQPGSGWASRMLYVIHGDFLMSCHQRPCMAEARSTPVPHRGPPVGNGVDKASSTTGIPRIPSAAAHGGGLGGLHPDVRLMPRG